LPLGLELAASWVDILSLAGIAAEIQKSLDFLETDVRNVPQRQRSIRAVFDASWQRLNAAEQKIFPQLSVFRGGFTRRAVQEITGASLRLLGTLASKSLLQYDKDRDRYQIHELLRQYGAEKLAASSQKESDLRDRHSAYYCMALREREADLKGARQQAALREIEADSENVRAAWHWAVQKEDTAQLALAMNTLGTFYEWQGRFRDGAAAFQALLASPLVSARHEPLFSATAMAWASVFQRMVETTEVAQETLAQALKRLESLESPVDGHAEQAFLHYQQGNLALSKENAAAQAAFLTSLGLYRQIGDQWGIARALHGLGETLLWLGDFAAAGTHLAESLEMYRSLGDLRGWPPSPSRPV
jgi:tetratricopeptide (TPR) repeat protein